MLILFASALLAAPPVPDADDDQRSPKAQSQPAGSRDTDDEEAPKAKPQPSSNANRDDEQTPIAKSAPSAPHDSDDQDEERSRPQSAIVVTARRLDAARTKIDQGLGSTVYSLSNDAIENRPGGETGSIANILGQTPGVGLSNFGLNVRGSRSIQVRINDVILPEATLDPAEHLTSRLAETTTLITGTLPAQFGFAPAGVISVTTKNGHYDHGGQAEFFGDTRGMLEPAFEWAGSAGGSSLFGSGSYERSRDRVGDSVGFSAKDIRHEVEGLAFGDQLLGQNDRISFILGGSRETHRIGETSVGSGVSRNSDGYGVATFQHSAEGLTLQASLFGAAASEKADFNTLSRDRRTSAGTQIDASYELGSRHVLRAGLLLTRSTSREFVGAGAVPDERRTSLGLYAQDEWKIGTGLTFNPGIRAEWLTGLGSSAELEPRASFVWTGRGGLTAHIGYARYAVAVPLGEEGVLGELKPERDDYFDVGVQHRLGGLTLGADAYWRKARNLLVERETPGSAFSNAFVFQHGRFRGIEFSSTYSHGPVTVWANFTISKAQGRTIVGGASLFSAAALVAADSGWINLAADRPFSASGGLTWRLGKLSFGADVTTGSGAVRTLDTGGPNGTRSSAFASFGLAAVYHANIAGQPADLRADFTNITNVHYRTSDASNLEGGWSRFAQGRALMLGIEQGF